MMKQKKNEYSPEVWWCSSYLWPDCYDRCAGIYVMQRGRFPDLNRPIGYCASPVSLVCARLRCNNPQLQPLLQATANK